MSDQTATVLIIAILSVVAFSLLREVFCWYWKINQRIEILKNIENQITKISWAKIDKDRWECPECGVKNLGDAYECAKCGYKLK